MVEAQHTASTMRLTDSLEEQEALELVLEASKPPLPPAVRRLHYLLATPFRYRPHVGSRFRAAFDAGVWYGAEMLRTALSEKSYWRLRFLLDSPGTPDLKAVPHTAFRAPVRTTAAIDLTLEPLRRDRAVWTRLTSYEGTQAFARVAREAQIQIIRYESVRDPEHAACAAVLDPAVFGRSKPRSQETWFIAASRERVRAARERGEASWEFTRAQLLGEG
ncbi:MAG TPA: RES family NAD+ phosphorylase [Steroidobacteraceae bacterium]|nr:RES family NAD+ phosphorylase [Steroidobacteraceae bacterium]